MAEVPEMDSILMSSGNEEEFYADCPGETKNSIKDLHWDCLGCSSGIKLEITMQQKSAYSFKKIVVLVKAVQKLNGAARKACRFSNIDLIDLLLVEEEIPFRKAESTFASRSSYRYFTSENFRIRDSANKCLVFQDFPGEANLVAMYLQGGNISREENISMAYFSSQHTDAPRKKPVALGLVGRNLYLSCVPAGDVPELQLEEVKNIKDIKAGDLERFLFLKPESLPSGSAKASFESASFRGWYISTSQSESELVHMSHEKDQRSIYEFNLFKLT